VPVSDLSTPPAEATAPPRERPGAEVIAVLLVSLGMSGIYALLSLIRSEITVQGGIGNATATVVAGTSSAHQWLDVLDDLANILNGVGPIVLALVLLARWPGGPGFGIGFGTVRLRRSALQGAGFCALIGIPGLALVYVAHRLGLNASLEVVNFPDVWYRVPYLLLSALQNGAAEEVVVVGYLLTRLRQMNWSNQRALLASATLRGSYHLYQGFGGFAGNFVMGLIFGWWFQRSRRVMPLVIAHFLLDAISFVGYVYLHRHISWI